MCLYFTVAFACVSSYYFAHTAIEAKLKIEGIPFSPESCLLALEDFELKLVGNPNMRGNSFFTEEYFYIWAEQVREYSHMGFPFTERRLQAMMQEAAREHHNL
jgi:hypothetical protein